MSTSAHTVFIPVKNEENNLQRCLDSILLSAGTNVDVHVFDDCSTDRTAEILQEYADRHDNIHAHKGFGKGPAIIRNYFLEEVTNPYIIFVDGDIEVQSNWYQEIERSISKMSDTIVAIGGAQKIPHISKGLEKFHGALLESFSFLSDHIQQASDFVEVKHNPLCNVIYKTQPLKDVQGFDEHLFPGEDLDMDIRLYRNGYKFLYNPEMVVYHHRPDTIKEFQTMLIKYGKTQAYLLKKHGMTQTLQWVPIICLFCLAIVLMYPELLLWVLGALLLFFLFRTNKFLYGLTMPVYALVSLATWNYGFLKGLSRKVMPTHLQDERPNR